MNEIEKELDSLWFQVQAKMSKYKCEICCVDATGVPAHHIYGRGKSVRWEIDNGIQLCLNCHVIAHKNVKKFRRDFGNDRMTKLFHSTVKYVDYEAIRKKLLKCLEPA